MQTHCENDVSPERGAEPADASRLDRVFGPAVPLVLFAALLATVAAQAWVHDVLLLDEPLWFMRSSVLPTDMSHDDYVTWAVDVPAVNRWVYYAVLHATGFDEIPRWEWPCWTVRDGDICWYDWPIPDHLRRRYWDTWNLEWWERNMGAYAPRRAIMAMRVTNIVFFAVLLLLLWWTARRILRSRSLATLAVLPIAIVPAFATWQGVSFVVWSGDVFMAAAVAAALAVWLRFHLKGAGASLKCVLAVAVLVGLATGSKQSGVLAVWAFAAYLAWASRGARRVLNPLIFLAVAAAMVVVTNPVFLLHPSKAPWEVGLDIIQRRTYVVERFIFSNGPCSVFELITSTFYWWPVLPMGLLAVWACRREPWFPPVAFWSGFLSIGSAMGLIEMRMLQERYTAPLEMGIYFLFAVCGITVARRYNAEWSRVPPRQPAARELVSLDARP